MSSFSFLIDDVAPAPPTSLTVSGASPSTNLITFPASSAVDVERYELWAASPFTSNQFQPIASDFTSGSTASFDFLHGKTSYKIKATDFNENVGDFTSVFSGK